MHVSLGGIPLFKPPRTYNQLRDHIIDGWAFQATRLSEEFGIAQFHESRPEGTLPILWIKPSQEIVFASAEGAGEPATGDVIVSFGPPRAERDQEKIVRGTLTEREARREKARKTSEEVTRQTEGTN